MTTTGSSKYWTPLIILLIAGTTVGGILAWSRYRDSKYEEISISKPPSEEQVNQIYVGGAVNNPGFYPLTDGDSIEAVIQAAGGTATSADLTADAMWEAELELIARRANLNSSVLKVTHHGSDTSTTPEFLAVVDPQLAVISVGKDNPYGHPSDKVIARLEDRIGPENIYLTYDKKTDEHHTIEFITDGERLWVKAGK